MERLKYALMTVSACLGLIVSGLIIYVHRPQEMETNVVILDSSDKPDGFHRSEKKMMQFDEE